MGVGGRGWRGHSKLVLRLSWAVKQNKLANWLATRNIFLIKKQQKALAVIIYFKYQT